MPLPRLEGKVKVVLDTNNLVSSQINKKGASFKIFNLFRANKIVLYTSPFQLRELERVLNYPRITKKFRLEAKKIRTIVSIIKRYARTVYPTETPEIIREDQDDNQILAIVKEAKADFIISGDEHLLNLKKINHTPILPAREFLKIIKVAVD